jgi:hypothetical protein
MSGAPTPRESPTTTIFEFKGCAWFNGSEAGDIGVLKRELPAVDLGCGDDAFCAVWLGPRRDRDE